MNKEKVDKDTNRLVVSIGSEIRKHRKDQGLTQERLAELAGINEKYLSSIENGSEANLSVGYLVRISSAMGLTFFDLLPDS